MIFLQRVVKTGSPKRRIGKFSINQSAWSRLVLTGEALIDAILAFCYDKEMSEVRPKVGVGVMVLKDGKVLLAKRKGAHGEGEYAFPGGHLEFGESFENCAARETKEEVGISIKDIHFQYLANVTKYPGKHYAHIGMTAQWSSGKPKVLEPDRSESWNWFSLDDLPRPVFEFCRLHFESYKTGKIYFGSV